MDLIKKTFIIFAICFLGNIISKCLPFPFPGSVLAMILLFVCLVMRAIKPKQIESVADFLLGNMSLAFIPATVSIISYIDVLKNIWLEFLIICIVSTLVTFAATCYSVKFTVYIMNKRKERGKNA